MTLRRHDTGETVEDPRGLEGLSGTMAPGLVDLQLNGGFGHDFTTDPESIWAVAARLPEFGVTAFLPTVISAPPEVAVAALGVLAAGPPPHWRGARPLGLHVEGPMISPRRRGTHPPEALVEPSLEVADLVIRSGPPTMVTIAPELRGAEEIAKRFVEAGTVVSLGHTDATAAEAATAADWGATHATHLFNAMSGLDHRTPGVAATVLTDDRFTTGLIADGIHVDAAMLRLALRAKGPERIALVTDAMSAMGLTAGAHTIGSTSVVVDGVTVRNAEGNLAGSAATMDMVLRTMIDSTGCGLADAITMASTTPARIVGHTPPADNLVVLDDDLGVVATVVDGAILHRRDEP